MHPLLAEISTGETWMIALTGATVVVMAVGTFWKRQEVSVQQPLDVQLVESMVSKEEFSAHREKLEHELQLLWTTVRNENTAIRREITDAVTHSQEVLLEKLENNRVELGGKMDNISDRVIATLRNTGAIGGNHL